MATHRIAQINRETLHRVWKAMLRLPRVLAAVLTFVLRTPRLVLEAGGRVDHREAMDRHLRTVWSEIGSQLQAAAGDEAAVVVGRSDR